MVYKHSDETKKKISESMKKAFAEGRLLSQEQYKEIGKKNHQKSLSKNVTIMTTGRKEVVLDITRRELEEYRKIHQVCEICGSQSKVITYCGNTGRTTPNQLSINHDHQSGKFRGLLCVGCNRRLGWYEKLKDNIKAYLGE